MIQIYCDGSSQGTKEKGRTGRFGIIFLKEENIIKEFQSPVYIDATNSDMEVKALLEVLKQIENFKDEKNFKIFSDSQYTVKGFNQWVHGWAENNWEKELKQQDWKEIYNLKIKFLLSGFNIQVDWLRGHNGDKWNEYVDKLAQAR